MTSGYRGYVASRPVRGQDWPQHAQNILIRDYAQRRQMHYLLSATEYAMPGCYMNLEAVLNELPQLHGVICFSLFMLPKRRFHRYRIYERILGQGRELHGALEGIAVRSFEDAMRVEDIFLVDRFAARDAMPDADNDLYRLRRHIA